MSEHGYTATTISMITELTGLPPSSIYFQFGSKENLLAEVLEHVATNIRLAVLPGARTSGGGRGRVGLIRQACAGAPPGSSDSRRLLMMVALQLSDSGDRVTEALQHIRRRRLDEWKRAIIEIGDLPPDSESCEEVERLAEFALAASDGWFLASQVVDEGHSRALGEVLTRTLSVLAQRASADLKARRPDRTPSPTGA